VHVFCDILRKFGWRNSGRAWRITYYPIADERPGGPDRRLIFLNPIGPYRHLGLALKILVQTGRDFEAPFKTVRSRASSKPDWPDYWEPCFSVDVSRTRGTTEVDSLPTLDRATELT
jgi:hypothetical protein